MPHGDSVGDFFAVAICIELKFSEPTSHRIHGAAIYGAPWIPSIYPSHVSIYTSTMDPMG